MTHIPLTPLEEDLLVAIANRNMVVVDKDLMVEGRDRRYARRIWEDVKTKEPFVLIKDRRIYFER